MVSWVEFYVIVYIAFEELIGETRGKYCVGDEVTLADAFLVPQLFNAARFEVDMTKYKNIREIAEALYALPEFDAAKPENQPDAE